MLIRSALFAFLISTTDAKWSGLQLWTLLSAAGSLSACCVIWYEYFRGATRTGRILRRHPVLPVLRYLLPALTCTVGVFGVVMVLKTSAEDTGAMIHIYMMRRPARRAPVPTRRAP